MTSATIHLRGFGEPDDDGLRALFDDPETRLWNPDPSTDLEEWRDRQGEESQEFVTWAVADDADDRFLGIVSVFDIDLDQGTAEMGYRVVPTERGHGVATAALIAAARRVFEERGLRRLQLFHGLANPASCRVAERAGFRLEGTLRQSYRYGDGLVHDEHLHARLASDPVAG